MATTDTLRYLIETTMIQRCNNIMIFDKLQRESSIRPCVEYMSYFLVYYSEKGLKGGGTLVIGARKKVDGTLINLFKGSISNLNIWDRAFDEGEIRKLFLGCEAFRGNVLPWCETIIGSMIKHEVYIKSPSTACASSCKFNALFSHCRVFVTFTIKASCAGLFFFIVTQFLQVTDLRKYA